MLPGVLHHHERWDGTGYPDRLRGEQAPLPACILAVADAYDAMTSARPYREARPHRQVEEILTAGAGEQWDRRVVEAFLRRRHKVHSISRRGPGESRGPRNQSGGLPGAAQKSTEGITCPSLLFPR